MNDYNHDAGHNLTIKHPLLTGAELISKERERQMSQEGWDAQHDNRHLKAELTQAAICYALDVAKEYETRQWKDMMQMFSTRLWPWDKIHWKPTPDNRIRQLTKAGALIAAEIDRLQRLGGFNHKLEVPEIKHDDPYEIHKQIKH